MTSPPYLVKGYALNHFHVSVQVYSRNNTLAMSITQNVFPNATCYTHVPLF